MPAFRLVEKNYFTKSSQQIFHEKYANSSNSTCWEWQQKRDKQGYGVFSYRGSKWGSHRLAYLFFHGYLPNDKLVCHSCDNPPCVNPSHLFLGSHLDNSNDKLAKDRARGGKASKLTKEDVSEIRRLGGSVPVIQLSRQYGVGDSHITNILRGIARTRG